MRPIEDFMGFVKGDIITLSSLQIMEDHDIMELDLSVLDVRTYQEPNGVFKYTGYVASSQDESNDTTYMILVRQIDEEYDIMLYYLDTEGNIEEARELMLNEEGDDLVDRFELETEDTDGNSHKVTWDKQHRFFGVEYEDLNEDTQKVVGLYFTDDECGGNPHGFVEWTGDDEEGYIEVWLGSELKDHEINILSTQE